MNVMVLAGYWRAEWVQSVYRTGQDKIVCLCMFRTDSSVLLIVMSFVVVAIW